MFYLNCLSLVVVVPDRVSPGGDTVIAFCLLTIFLVTDAIKYDENKFYFYYVYFCFEVSYVISELLYFYLITL